MRPHHCLESDVAAAGQFADSRDDMALGKEEGVSRCRAFQASLFLSGIVPSHETGSTVVTSQGLTEPRQRAERGLTG